MSRQCTEEQFLKDVAEHQITVLRDDGVNRHIRFKQPGTSCMHFDLITWPGYLCYCGDMGTYVFQRLTDMFEFFRRGDKSYRIDYRYWAEKCEASDTNGRGIEKFSHEKFQAYIKDWIDQAEKGDKPDETDQDGLIKHTAAYAELREAVQEEVLNADDYDIRCYDAADNFHHEGEAWKEAYGPKSGFQFHDLSDGLESSTKEYTHSFIWCCMALAWGIKQYDLAKGGVGADDSISAVVNGAAA